jgi:hypothetical protein
MSYHTAEIVQIKALLVENDRTPVNLALIHLAREQDIKTVKYDNWLISPVHYNDVYCEYYYYPSLYHKNIIQRFESNDSLQFIEGGFAYWDNLKEYKKSVKMSVKKVIYFTQIDTDISEHIKHIKDISAVMDELNIEYSLIIKTHPRENSKPYKKLFSECEVVDICSDLYALISQADYCFSIFSTVSLEAKHIVKNSFFINYNTENFDRIDYNGLQLDVIKNKEELYNVFTGEFVPISQDEFIQAANCSYPHSTERLRKLFCDD